MKGIIKGQLIVKNPPKKLAESILSVFTFENPEYVAANKYSPWGPPKGISPVIQLAYEKNNRLFIPRGIDPEILLPDKLAAQFDEIDWVDRRISVRAEFPRVLITPNAQQLALLRAFRRARIGRKRPFDTYAFVAPTSAGKTMFLAMCAARLKERTLVLCHTNLIRNSWYQDLYKCFGIAKRDVGLIQQNTFHIGEYFTLASPATLDRRQHRWDEIFENFGCLIVDEVQKLEPRIVRFIRRCPVKYMIGATATERKEEGENYYLHSFFGSIVKKILPTHRDTHSSMALKGVDVVKTKFVYKYDRLNIDVNDLALSVAADEERNKLIVDRAVADWEEGHSVLIAVRRTAHLQVLIDMLREQGVEDANPLYGETNAKKKYTQALIKSILSRKVRMVVSTIPAVKLGANLNPLDRLHLVWPPNRADLEQIIGRIRRRAKGKNDTKLIYYLDRKVPYLFRRFVLKALPVFRKMRVPGWEHVFGS